MQNLLSSFKEFNNKHKKLVPFIIYFEIIAVILASAFKYIRKNLKLVGLILLIIAVIIFAIRYLTGNDNKNVGNAGVEIVETVSVDEIMASLSVSGSSDETSVVGTSEDGAGAASSESTDAADAASDATSEDATEASYDTSIIVDTANDAASDSSTTSESYVSSVLGSRPVAKLPKEGISKFIAVYPETIAWLWFEDDRLNYPIMQSEDNTKYAIKDFQGQDSETGSLFLDYRATADFTDSNSIIYGHNMRDRTMFGALRTYKDDLGFLANHKYFQIITPEGRTRYMIFAFMDVPKNSYIYDVVGANSDNMREFLDTIEYKTYIDTGIEPTVDDKIITLSTCTQSDTLFFVMFAVEVE